jgi:hypothetical protein
MALKTFFPKQLQMKVYISFSQFSNQTSYTSWTGLILLSMLAIVFLPRQFQPSVVENVMETHLKKAIRGFPIIFITHHLFCTANCFGGQLLLGNSNISPDNYVLALPMQNGASLLGSLYIYWRVFCCHQHDHRRINCHQYHDEQQYCYTSFTQAAKNLKNRWRQTTQQYHSLYQKV